MRPNIGRFLRLLALSLAFDSRTAKNGRSGRILHSAKPVPIGRRIRRRSKNPGRGHPEALRRRQNRQLADHRSRRRSPTTKCGWTTAKRPTAARCATTMKRGRPSKSTSIATPLRLRDDMRLITVHSDKAGVSISSPHGPLTREELDLIDLPGNTLVLDGLLPDAKEKIGDSWKIADSALAKLVCVDLVSRNEVTCELSDVERIGGGNQNRRPAQRGRRRRGHGNRSRWQRCLRLGQALSHFDTVAYQRETVGRLRHPRNGCDRGTDFAYHTARRFAAVNAHDRQRSARHRSRIASTRAAQRGGRHSI